MVLSGIPRAHGAQNGDQTIENSLWQGDPVIIEVVKLDYADAEHLATVLSPLLTKEGTILPYKPTNSLIIKDRASVVKQLIALIKGTSDP